jgi:homoserine dehydrogenase
MGPPGMTDRRHFPSFQSELMERDYNGAPISRLTDRKKRRRSTKAMIRWKVWGTMNSKVHSRSSGGRDSQLGSSKCNLIMVGPRGQVGSALRRLLVRQGPMIANQVGVELCLKAAYDRHGIVRFVDAPDTLDISRFMVPRSRGDTASLFDELIGTNIEPCLLIDCTASDDIADAYENWLSNGIGIVAANKRANARDLAYYLNLRYLAQVKLLPYRYETTVGAAVPLLGPLRDIRMRGERVTSIRGVLSGSLSYIIHRLHEDVAFSVAVDEARALGYTEPDPMEDLRAVDLSRKLLVLAREAGFMLEASDLQVQRLCEIEVAPGTDIIHALRAEDELWRERVSVARSRNERLVILAEVDGSGARVALRSLGYDSPFSSIQPGQNVVMIETDLQQLVPLTMSGPGAGIEVTAAGVLSDIVAAASQLVSTTAMRM